MLDPDRTGQDLRSISVDCLGLYYKLLEYVHFPLIKGIVVVSPFRSYKYTSLFIIKLLTTQQSYFRDTQFLTKRLKQAKTSK